MTQSIPREYPVTMVSVRLVRQASDLLMKHADGQKTSEREVRDVIDRLRGCCDEDEVISEDDVAIPSIAVVNVTLVVDPTTLEDYPDSLYEEGLNFKCGCANQC
jgi:hypothetical protein